MRETTEALSAAERRAELAVVLAQGVLRLRRCQAAVSRPERTPEETSKKVSYSLELGANPSPHAPVFKGGRRRQKGA